MALLLRKLKNGIMLLFVNGNIKSSVGFVNGNIKCGVVSARI